MQTRSYTVTWLFCSKTVWLFLSLFEEELRIPLVICRNGDFELWSETDCGRKQTWRNLMDFLNNKYSFQHCCFSGLDPSFNILKWNHYVSALALLPSSDEVFLYCIHSYLYIPCADETSQVVLVDKWKRADIFLSTLLDTKIIMSREVFGVTERGISFVAQNV
jgi:hypothetical protein